MTSLNTELTSAGVELTFDDGRDAGTVVPIMTDYRISGWKHRHGLAGSFSFGPERLTREAAEYDGLAWATDEDERIRRREAA